MAGRSPAARAIWRRRLVKKKFGDNGGGGIEGMVVENFEGDTIGENEATLEAKSTHYALGGANVACRAIDYLNLPAIKDNRFAKCCYVQAGNPTSGFSDIQLASGAGWTPSNGGHMVTEAVLFQYGAQAYAYLHCLDPAGAEGIKAEVTALNIVLYTRTGSTDTQKFSVAHGLTGPFSNAWMAFMMKYNYSTNLFQARVKQLGVSAPYQGDTGWVGQVVVPTFNAATEQRRFVPGVGEASPADGGVAQQVIHEYTGDYNNGAAQPHNYTVPV
jgi:hypothetical protein